MSATPKNLTGAESGEAGLALVREALEAAGFDCAATSTGRAQELSISLRPKTRRLSARVYINRAPRPAGGTGRPALAWMISGSTATDYVAVADLSSRRIWLFSTTEAFAAAQQHPSSGSHHLIMVIGAKAMKSKHARIRDIDFIEYLLPNRVNRLRAELTAAPSPLAGARSILRERAEPPHTDRSDAMAEALHAVPTANHHCSESTRMRGYNDEVDELEFDQPLEDDTIDVGVGVSDRKIYTEQGDPEIESLHGRFKRGRLIVQPDFQRHFVWDVVKCSRLIESALLEIPLPVVYLSEEGDGKEYVIDGQQRLTSFFSFLDGQLPDGKEFRLKGLKVFKELERKRFKELDDVTQDKIRYCKLRSITFKKESDANLKFEVFERLNTGAVSLNDQELRNCIYRGPYNNLLRELSGDDTFRHLLGLTLPDKRMKDVELVLRWAAFHHATYLKYRSPMRAFLNHNMMQRQFITPDEANELRDAFRRTVSVIKSLLDSHAFKRFYRGNASQPDGRWELKKFNASLYDILMYSFAREDKNVVYQHLDAVRESFIDLMTTDQEFIDAIELSTSSVQAVTKRFDKWRMRVQDVIGAGRREPRLFTRELKNSMFNANPVCGLCGNAIESVDDSAVDHVKQYWLGGATIPANARLAHRYCNASRPRHD